MDPKLLSALTDAAIVLVPLATAALAAWLRERAKARIAADAAEKVELLSRVDPDLRGETKLKMAQAIMRRTEGALTSMRPAERKKQIEKVLPAVLSSLPPPPPESGPRSRK